MSSTSTQTQPSALIRPGAQRGRIDHGWLDARHTFSFGRYMDPRWMGFRSLRVINEDRIAPRMGFGEHPHRDMEIITYPISGALRHRDSLGNEEDITPGMIQLMSAGSGIRHSEFNPGDEPTHLLQIWIEPREKGIEPEHRSRLFPIHEEPGRLRLLASPDGAGDSLTIHSNARVWAGVLPSGERLEHPLENHDHAWVQLVRGALRVNGTTINTGDGLALSGVATLDIQTDETSEVLVFGLD